ncbi:oligoendopeptidase F [Catenovulum agarivorans]|uniref:oligoendopeptidase F n=1 Tax=Catenovulum agarivorans TaxID=1172192 RepID=UPI00030E8F48|nr:oligoendopeptidase F [Catenovulum agarivorans]
MKLKLLSLIISANLLTACSQTSALSGSESASEPANQQTISAAKKEKSAKVVDEKYIWDLTDLYASDEQWQQSHSKTKGEIDKLKALQGSLGKNAQSLLIASNEISAVYKDAVRLLVYATLKADENLKVAENEERRQLAKALLSDLSAAVSWYSPEILAIGEKKIRQFLKQEPRLKVHQHSLENTLRNSPHTLSQEVEAVLAKTGKLTSAPNSIYSVLANANLPWPEITLSTGETQLLNQAGYSKLRQASSREDRQKVFETFWGTWKDYEATLGSILNSHIQGLVFHTQVRNHETSVSRALFGDNMPETVYRTLIKEVNDALPTLHRYFKLRKRMLNIEDDMRYFDIYPPLVELDKTYSIEDSIAITRRALKPLGAEFLAAYDKGVEGRWMHVYPQEGKRSGAYMFGAAYDVHPYVLLNHNDDFQSASTFAHEYGHAVHSVLSNKTQPWETAGYATFIAETASIMNEMLLEDMVISEAQTDQEKLYYLGIGLEALRGTFFRQTMFAEFELKINDAAEAGEILTGAKLSEMYLELLKRYHGHDQGVMTIDDAYAMEWAYIPHFYYDFYVFQYATSIAAAAGLAEKIGHGDIQARDAYIDMLKAGGSDYPYDLMKTAGVDMATAEPYRALVKRMNNIMDEMERILAK